MLEFPRGSFIWCSLFFGRPTHCHGDHTAEADHHCQNFNGQDLFIVHEEGEDADPERARLEDDHLESKWNEREAEVEDKEVNLACQTAPEECLLLSPGELFYRIQPITGKLDTARDQ